MAKAFTARNAARGREQRAAEALVEAVAIMDKLLDYVRHDRNCRHPRRKCKCGLPEVLVKARRFGVFLSLLFSLSSQAQTNLPPKPMPTMGADVQYSVVCTVCEREQVLVPNSVVVHKVTPSLGGQIQDVTFAFSCTNPKCLKDFTWDTQRWIRAPIRLPAKATNSVAAGPSTNAMPKRK